MLGVKRDPVVPQKEYAKGREYNEWNGEIPVMTLNTAMTTRE